MVDIQEINLSGEKLGADTNNLDMIAQSGSLLYKNNKDFIKEKVKDNWFVIIEPVSGTLLAGPDQLQLFKTAKKKFPERLFYSVGLLKENFNYFHEYQ